MTDFNRDSGRERNTRRSDSRVPPHNLNAEESLLGATRHAAVALGRGDRMGSIAEGMQADFLVWDVDHPAEIVCSLGVNRLASRVFRGTPDEVAS